MADHYADGTCRWGRALDVGCGLGTEAGYLHRAGWQVVGLDLSPVALAGVRNDIDEHVIRATFDGWSIEALDQTQVPSDTRSLDVLLVRISR